MAEGADPELLETIIPYTAVAFLVLACSSRLKGALTHHVLGGLLYISLQRAGEVDVQQAAAAGLSKKQVKKIQQQVKSAAKSSNTTLKWYAVHPALLDNIPFSDEFDKMLLACVIFVFAVVMEMLMKAFLTPKMSNNFFGLTVATFGFVLVYVLKVEWLHTVITKADKVYMLIAGLLGCGIAFSLLSYTPHHLLDFNTAAATKELMGRLQALMREPKAAAFLARMELPAPQLPQSEPAGLVMAIVMSILAGALSGLLMNPGLRYARVLQTALKPPMWFRHIARPTWGRFAAQLAAFVQVLIVPLWVPVLTDALFISRDVLPYIRGVSLLLLALLQGCAVPQLVQAFLFTAPYQADVIDNTPDLDAEIKGQLIKRQCAVCQSQLCKAAMQLAFVPCLLLVCSCVHILMSFTSSRAETHARVNEWDMKPSLLFQTVTGFMGWWASTAFLSWAILGTLLARLKGIDL